MVEKNNLNKKFIKEALGSRNYFSYRTDLVLYKIMLSILVMLVIFLITSDWSLSFAISIEVFAIFTLINKLKISRKKNEGEEKLLIKMKKEHFKKKIEEINPEDFEILIGFLFEKKGYKNFIKKGRHMFLAEKEGLINCIKIYKLYDDIELEKIDVRNLITYMRQYNVNIAHIITTGSLSEGANELIEKFKDKLKINILDLDGMLSLMDEFKILPENEYFYNKASEEKPFKKKKAELKNNVLDYKKIFVYMLGSIFFYVTSTFMPENNISKYISIYFILLTIACLSYLIWIKYISKEMNN